jgi:stearoyl-CoA desaturase (Delta-9 desaturase)
MTAPSPRRGEPRTGYRRVAASRLRLHTVAVTGSAGIGTVLALLYFPPTTFDVGLLTAGWLLTGLGISIGFHRYLAHRAFDLGSAAKVIILCLGSAAGNGPPAYWVSLHRNHHRHSDRPGDPHSPVADGRSGRLRGFFHAHFGWIHATGTPYPDRTDVSMKDSTVRQISRRYPLIVLSGVLLPTLLGAAHMQDVQGAIHGALWGGAVRLILVNNIIWSINSVCHLWGRQRYQTGDSSKNNWLLAIPSLGESWHNNHHIAPGFAAFGHRWWEIDLSYYVILLLARVGIARQPRELPHELLEKMML